MNNSFYITNSENIRTSIYSFLYLPTYKPGDVNIAQSLLSRSEIYYYAAQKLDPLVKTWQVTTEIDQRIRNLWNDLFQNLEEKKELFVGAVIHDLNRIFSQFYLQNKEEFRDTDLIIYPDNYLQTLPASGVQASEFQNLRKLYRDVLQMLEIEEPVTFQEFMKKNIRILLTRKEGREFFQELLRQSQGKTRFKIERAKKTLFISSRPNEIDTIQFSTDKFLPILYLLKNDQKVLVYPLDFTELFHEFVHLLHAQTDKGVQKQNLCTQANDPVHFPNLEEEITIQGPGFNENQILASFGLFSRIQYLVPLDFSPDYSEWNNLYNLALVNLPDQYARLLKIIPASRTRKIIETLRKENQAPSSAIEILEKMVEEGYYFEFSKQANSFLYQIFKGYQPDPKLLIHMTYQEVKAIVDNLLYDLLEPFYLGINDDPKVDEILGNRQKSASYIALEMIESELESRMITEQEKEIITPEYPFDFLPSTSPSLIDSSAPLGSCPSLPLSPTSLSHSPNQCYALSTGQIISSPPPSFYP